MKTALLVILAVVLGFGGGYYVRNSSAQDEIWSAQDEAKTAVLRLVNFDETECIQHRSLLTQQMTYCEEANEEAMVQAPQCRAAIVAGVVKVKPLAPVKP
jgi:hypothetical protein